MLCSPATTAALLPAGHLSAGWRGRFFAKINTPEFLDQIAESSDQLQRGLQNLAEKSDLVTEVRGQGMIWGVVTTVPAADVVKAAQAHGLLILSAGTNVVRLLPPLTITSQEIDLLLNKLQAALNDE